VELNPSGIQRFSASGGGGGIRTPEALAGLTVFKTAAFNRSATPPAFWILALSLPVCPWRLPIRCPIRALGAPLPREHRRGGLDVEGERGADVRVSKNRLNRARRNADTRKRNFIFALNLLLGWTLVVLGGRSGLGAYQDAWPVLIQKKANREEAEAVAPIY
jgi:hypothetical protein